MEKTSGQLNGLLAEGCSFDGIVIFEGILRIDGTLTGKVVCRPNKKGTLIVSHTARVEIDLLSVDILLVSGQFYGSGPIIALEQANFHGNSRVEISKKNTLYSSNLIVRDKALFQGKSVMIRHESFETKNGIKNLIYQNRLKTITLPIKQNPLLSDLDEE